MSRPSTATPATPPRHGNDDALPHATRPDGTPVPRPCPPPGAVVEVSPGGVAWYCVDGRDVHGPALEATWAIEQPLREAKRLSQQADPTLPMSSVQDAA
jgi:hypothetical protein